MGSKLRPNLWPFFAAKTKKIVFFRVGWSQGRARTRHPGGSLLRPPKTHFQDKANTTTTHHDHTQQRSAQLEIGIEPPLTPSRKARWRI